jgi:hypothetical protein
MTNLELSFWIFFFLLLTAYFIAKAFQNTKNLYTRKQVEKAILEARNHDLHKDEIIENL